MPAVPLGLLTTIIDAEDGKHYKIMAVAEKEDGDDEAEKEDDSSQQAPTENGLFSFETPGYKEIDQSREK